MRSILVMALSAVLAVVLSSVYSSLKGVSLSLPDTLIFMFLFEISLEVSLLHKRLDGLRTEAGTVAIIRKLERSSSAQSEPVSRPDS